MLYQGQHNRLSHGDTALYITTAIARPYPVSYPVPYPVFGGCGWGGGCGGLGGCGFGFGGCGGFGGWDD